MRSPSDTCNFGPLKEEMIRDKIVCGVRGSSLTLGRVYVHANLYSRRGTKGVGGEVEGTPPRVFHMLQYFETILPSVESL